MGRGAEAKTKQDQFLYLCRQVARVACRLVLNDNDVSEEFHQIILLRLLAVDLWTWLIHEPIRPYDTKTQMQE